MVRVVCEEYDLWSFFMKNFKYIYGIALAMLLACVPVSTASAAEEVRNTLHSDDIGIDLRAFFENQIEQMDKEYWHLVIAQVDDYVNVRSLPGEEGEVVGKLYNNSVGELLAGHGTG